MIRYILWIIIFFYSGFVFCQTTKRTYPGGIDDSDLIVQSLRPIAKQNMAQEEVSHGDEEGDYEVVTPDSEAPTQE